MSTLQSTFDQISKPKSSSKSLKGISLKSYKKKIWICKDSRGFPTLVLRSSEKFIKNGALDKEYALIKVYHNQNRIIESDGSKEEVYCSIIYCDTNEKDIVELFFETFKPMLKKLKFPINPFELNDLSENLIKLFRSLKNLPRKSTQGLWAELFLIYRSKSKEELISRWHKEIKDKYDFKKEKNFIEVKSTTSTERKHVFSLEQVNMKDYETVLIASFMLEMDEDGMSIEMLEKEIKKELEHRPDLVEELIYQIRSTLGSAWQSGRKQSFCEFSAEDKLKFFDLNDIPKLDQELKKIRGVSQIKFTSNLDYCSEIKFSKYKKKSNLFKSVLNKNE